MAGWRGCSEFIFMGLGILALLSTGATAAMLYFFWLPTGKDIGVFKEDISSSWMPYNECLINTDWMFYIWIIVYCIQIMWIAYGMILVCRKTKSDSYLYVNPPVFPATVFGLHFLTMGALIGWKFLWGDPKITKYAVALIFIAAVLSHAVLILSVHRVARHERQLLELGYSADIWFSRIVNHNIMSSLVTWLTLLLFYNLSAVLIEEAHLDPDVACYVNAGLILLYLIIFFIIDTILLVQRLAVLLLPYVVIGASQCATIYQNADAQIISESLHLIFAGAMMGIVAILFLVKIALIIVKFRNKPTQAQTRYQ